MSVFCAEARGTVLHRRTATTALMAHCALVSSSGRICGCCNRAVVLEVVREVDGGNAALPELALEAVAAAKGDGEAREDLACWISHAGAVR